MREVLMKVYTYNELSEKAKEKARQDYGSFGQDEADRLTEDFEYVLGDFGYTGAKLNWSLSSCQGDGVSFTGEWEGAELLTLCQRVYNGAIPKNIKRVLPFIGVRFERINNSNYYHEHTVRVEIEFKFDEGRDLSGRFIDAYIELRKTLNEDRLERCWELEKAGYQHIEWVEGEENFAEMCVANEWEFYEDGEMY